MKTPDITYKDHGLFTDAETKRRQNMAGTGNRGFGKVSLG